MTEPGKNNLLLEDIGLLLTMEASLDRSGGEIPAKLGAIPSAVLAVEDGAVRFAGPADELPRELAARLAPAQHSAAGALVSPGLVECHTHLVWGGDRELDFDERCSGVSYEAIARRGGGILSTVRMTREADEEVLFEEAMARMDELVRQGITTVEIKSGYGLTVEDELKILRVARRLDRAHPVEVVTTFLGAHVVPAEHRADPEIYVDLVIEEMLPEVRRQDLARFCDVFIEDGAFDLDRSRRILTRAAELGFKLKVHSEQLSRCGGTLLAAELGAVSADHLDHATAEDARALAAAGTVPVLLPGATLFLGKRSFPDGRTLRDAGARVALSTDWNPGSCMTANLMLMATLGCVQCGLGPADAWEAITANAAAALDLHPGCGRLRPGSPGDLLLLRAGSWREPIYHYGTNRVTDVFKRGMKIL